ncbi:interferon regulatory factor 4-like [Callithrix jacchus]
MAPDLPEDEDKEWLRRLAQQGPLLPPILLTALWWTTGTRHRISNTPGAQCPPMTSATWERASTIPRGGGWDDLCVRQGCEGKGKEVGGAGAAHSQPTHPLCRPTARWLRLWLFSGAALVREATGRAHSPALSSESAGRAAQRLLGPPPHVTQVRLPEPPPSAHVLQRQLPHLECRVQLWVAPDGEFAKRLCQDRLYWRGLLALPLAQPKKLERERTLLPAPEHTPLPRSCRTAGGLEQSGMGTRA